MKLYWKYIKPHIASFIIGPILMIVEVIGEILMPLFFSILIDQGITGGKGTSFIIRMGISMILVAVCMLAGGVGGAFFAIKASSNFANDLRKDLFKKVQKFSFANMDKFQTGSLITRLTNDITQIQNIMAMALRMMLRAPGMLIGAMIMAFIMNRKLSLVIFTVVPVIVILIIILLKVTFPKFQKMQEKLDNLNCRIQENLMNIRVVKSFVREGYEEKNFGSANKDLKDTSLHAMKIMILTMPFMQLAMNMTTVAIVWFGGKQIIAGTMTAGNLTAFTNYVIQILMSLIMLSMVILNSSRAMASSKRIREVMKEKIDLSDESASRKEAVIQNGKIEFRNVFFRYFKNNEEWVLQKLNLIIQPGQTIGIIGSTGCGKTSLVQLIPRLYDVDQGGVFVDDIDVREYNLTNLRNGVAMVLQNNVLFSGTIQENLLWGDENATREQIEESTKAAQAHEFITSFHESYETELGQGGVNLSGGQKQRLCIARALLKKPKILILDDSTSAVDTATEYKIRETFHKELKDATKIIIAQRISSVMDADCILVLDEGEIIESGTHTQLLNGCLAYREIYDSQMEVGAGA